MGFLSVKIREKHMGAKAFGIDIEIDDENRVYKSRV